MAKRPVQINTVFCLASYFKGNDFIRECKSLGHRVFLLTREAKLKDDWAFDSLDGVIPVADDGKIASFLSSAVNLAARDKPTHIVALEEGDVITAGRLREHFGLPGMLSSQARLFRDKLSMRQRAAMSGIRQANFVHLLNYQEIGEFMARFDPPWVVKPRADASAIGIKKIDESELVWRTYDTLKKNKALSERADAYLLEEFIEGDVFHVDSLVVGGKAAVSCANRYGCSPLEIAVKGGVSTSHTIEYRTKEQKQLLKANARVLKAFGFEKGVTHAEFIKSDTNGEFYFLEIGCRVGGAFTAEAFEAASGLNIWREWAKLEMAGEHDLTIPAPTRFDYGGVVVSLAKQEHPDTSAYTDPEIYFRADVKHHVALVMHSTKLERINELLKEYTIRFNDDFMAFAPQQDRPE